MKRGSPRAVLLPLLAVISLSACAQAPSEEHVINEPVTLEAIPGTDHKRITLTEQAIDRLDLQTAAVSQAQRWTRVSAGALIVDPQGAVWIYQRVGPRSFVREPVRVDHEEGDLAFLRHGPAPGREVVTVGAAELYGIENEIGH